MGQCPDGDEVDAGFGIFTECFFGDASRGFGFIFPVDALHGLTQGVGIEIVEHDAVDATMVEDTLQLVEVAYLDFYFQVFSFGIQIVVGAVDGGLDATSEVDVVVFEHDHVVEAYAVVCAAAAVDGVFLKQAHVGGGLAGVEELGVESVEHAYHAVGLGGDAREALHEVESSAFGSEDGTGMSLDGHQDLALGDGVTIVLEEGHGEAVVHDFEHTFAHLGATEDAILFGHHLGGAAGRRGYAGEGGMVAVADVLAEGHFNQFVKVVNVHHNSLVV